MLCTVRDASVTASRHVDLHPLPEGVMPVAGQATESFTSTLPRVAFE